MKVGILTYHRTLNYGGCLQALALRKALERLGHEVYYVDYFPDYHKRQYSVFNRNNYKVGPLKTRLLWFLHDLKCSRYVLKRQGNFNVYHKLYTIPYCRPLNEQYDVIVYGSDQIWRKQDALGDYNPIYFANNSFVAGRHISYSASMGVLPSEQVDISKIICMLHKFDKIAVRENELQKLLISNGLSNVVQTIDPTLLLSKEDWMSIFNISENVDDKYILIYDLNEGSLNLEAIKRFANVKGLKYKILKGHAVHDDTPEEITTAGPSEFLNLVYNAEYVFASSFHGLVFSIIFEKEFYTSFNKNAGRAISLLKSLGLTDRYLDAKQCIPDIQPKINYKRVIVDLENLKRDSLYYLKKNI